MFFILKKIIRSVIYLSNIPKIGKMIAAFFGLIEVPLLDLIHFIDKYIYLGSYHQLMFYFNRIYKSRVIPVLLKIDAIPIISPTEEILTLLRNVPSLKIGYCYCRVKHQKCTNPIWTCIHIGYPKQLDELGKRIPLKNTSFDEVKKLIIKAEKLGLVHQLLTAPTPNYVYVICNCCPCCCVMLQNAIKYHIQGVLIPSDFSIEYKTQFCGKCGKCIDRCYFKVFHFKDKELVVSQEFCVGCGLCVSTCPNKALKLIRRKG